MGSVPTIASAYTVGQRWTRKLAAQHLAALSFLLNPPRCEATLTTVPSPATATWQLVTLDTETYDTDAMHDLVTNPSRVTIATPGRYEVSAVASFAANATGDRRAQIRLNAAGAIGSGSQLSVIGSKVAAATAGATTSVELPPRDYLFIAGDYVELFSWQSSGGALAMVATPSTALRVRWVANS